MGLLGVIVAALAGFGVEAAWYMSLSRPWLEATGLPLGTDGRPVNGTGSPMSFAIGVLAMVLVAGMMRHVFIMSGVDSLGKGLLSGLGSAPSSSPPGSRWTTPIPCGTAGSPGSMAAMRSWAAA